MMEKPIYPITELGVISIYLLRNIINNKIYIGQTANSLETRFQYGNGYRCSTKMHTAIKEYGKENFQYEILDTAITQSEADKLETYYIKLYDSTNNDIGYNLLSGAGSHGKHSEGSKKQMSLSKVGKTHSEESRKNMSEAQKIRWAKMSEEEKNAYGNKVSIRQTGITHSEERCINISIAKTGKN